MSLEGLTRLLGYLRSAVRAGVPVPESLRTLAERVARPDERELLDGLARDLEGGAQLSQALAQRVGSVPPLVTRLIAAGERAGDLATPVDALAAYHLAQGDLERRISASLRYPKLVLAIGLGVAMPACGWASQQLTGLWGNYLTDSATIDAARTFLWPFRVAPWAWPVIVLAAFVLFRQRRGPLAWFASWVTHHLYAVGNVRAQSHAAGFARGLALLIKSKVPVPEAVELMRGFSADPLVADEVDAILRRLAAGATLSRALERSRVFPSIFAWFVSLGERSGELDRALDEAGATFGREAHLQAELLSSALEPILLVVLVLIFLPGIVAAYYPLISIFKGMNL